MPETTLDFGKAGQIAYVNSFDLALSAGPNVNEREFVAALHKRIGGRLRVLIPRPSRPLPELEGCRVTYLRRPERGQPLSWLLHERDLARQCLRLLDEQPVDLLVARIGVMPIGLARVMRSRRPRLALKHMTGFPTAFVRVQHGHRYLMAVAAMPFRAWLTKRLARQAIGMDACTPQLAASISENLGVDPARVAVIDNGTNTERFAPRDRHSARARLGLERFDPIVGFVGGHPSQRGGIEMIQAARAILAKYPRAGFVIVGGGERLDALSRLAADLGVSDRVVLPGVVDYERVPEYVAAFDVGLALDIEERWDAIGNANQKIRQYLASGRPAIATRGGNDFLVAHGLGTILESRDVEHVVSAIDRWLSLEPEAREALERRAVDFARRELSVAGLVEQRLAFWSRLAAAPPPAP